MLKVALFIAITLVFHTSWTQNKLVNISGKLTDETTSEPLPFVNILLKRAKDSSFVSGTISDETGLFTLPKVAPNDFIISISTLGYNLFLKEIYVGTSTDFINLGNLQLTPSSQVIEEVFATAKQAEITSTMEKKSYSVEDNLSQTGGSVLQAMENLPGITVQDNKVTLRGSNRVIILIDGKQSALTGFGGQSGLDNIPASSIDRIEIINNPSSKYDANGNAGIINIILKKEKKDGFNGKASLSGGLGALWIKKVNLADVRSQYQFTPKINPSISINYRKNKVNVFFQLDDLYTQTLNKNEFVTRTYDDGTVINQQTVRNRNTNFLTTNLGMDWYLNDNNQITLTGSFGSEKILDNGDQAFFSGNTNQRVRLWQFLEDELKTTVAGKLSYQHKFKQPGRLLNLGYLYTFHREDEKYFFTNTISTFTGKEAFKLLSDEHVHDINLDYTLPLKYGKLESGSKLRVRDIPTNMQFFPSAQSPLDINAGGKATYKEIIPAVKLSKNQPSIPLTNSTV